MAISAAMVKDLREKTGAGMMDCKKALTAVDGDMQKAIDYLREKGIAKAEKKAGRIAAEGAVGAYVAEDAKSGAVVEINCETDFAAGNEQFKELLAKIAKHIVAAKIASGDVDALNNSEIEGKKVSDLITEATATIGEKISLRRFARYESAGRVASYIHMGGKIGVLVDLTGGSASWPMMWLCRLLRLRRRPSTVQAWMLPISSMRRKCCASRLWRKASLRKSSIRWWRAASVSSTRKSALWSRLS